MQITINQVKIDSNKEQVILKGVDVTAYMDPFTEVEESYEAPTIKLIFDLESTSKYRNYNIRFLDTMCKNNSKAKDAKLLRDRLAGLVGQTISGNSLENFIGK